MTQEIVDFYQMYVNLANIIVHHNLSYFLYQVFHNSEDELITMFENH